jgi:hypothetical protein
VSRSRKLFIYLIHFFSRSHNRYVSCSECSYDSDNCTCNSADRCYCSLGGGDINAKLNKAEEQRRSPVASCHSDDKCYCSMGDGETLDGSTTWCDSDSCATASKCYCDPNEKKPPKKAGAKKEAAKKSKSSRSRNKDNFALDYELFTVGSSSKHVKPTEALSVKKSVEMAAVFADVKLSQTTDIKNLKPGKDKKTSKPKHHHKKQHDHDVVAVKNTKNSVKSKVEDIYKSTEVILRKDVEVMSKRVTKTEGYQVYQSVAPRPVSASLEDSLGYLP